MGATDLIVGIGSPHGDDAVGWVIVDRLAGRIPDCVRAVPIGEPTQMLPHLSGCRRLWIVDACRGDAPAGTIRRFQWPQVQPLGQSPRGRSTHALGVGETLRLAESLGRLPAKVAIYAVEISDATLPGDDISAAVVASLPQLERLLLREVRQAHSAGQEPLPVEVPD